RLVSLRSRSPDLWRSVLAWRSSSNRRMGAMSLSRGCQSRASFTAIDPATLPATTETCGAPPGGCVTGFLRRQRVVARASTLRASAPQQLRQLGDVRGYAPDLVTNSAGISSFPSLFRLQRWTELNNSSAGGRRGSGGLAMHEVMRALIARWLAL